MVVAEGEGEGEGALSPTEPNARKREQCGRLYPSVKQAKGKICGLLHRRSYTQAPLHSLTMTSDRTTPPALPLPFFLCSSSSCSSRARLHDEPTHHTVWLWLCYRYEMQEAGKARHGVAPGRALPAQEALVPRQRGAAAAQEYVRHACPSHALFCSVLFLFLFCSAPPVL